MATEKIISEDQLAIDWTLTKEDYEFVVDHSRGSNQHIKLAAQLCYLRRNSIFIGQNNDIPLEALSYLAKQFDSQLITILSFTKNSYSYTWEAQICNYLGYQKFSEVNLHKLESWILDKLCKETINKDRLNRAVIEYLKNNRIVLPSRITLGRFVNQHINKALNKFYRQIVQTISQDKLDELQSLITPKDIGAESYLSEIKQYPGNANSQVMNQYLGYFHKIKSLGVLECDLSSINPEVIEELAKKGKYLTSYQLRCIRSKIKRQAIIICFLHEASKSILDYLVDIYKTIFIDIKRRAKNEVSRIRETTSKNNKGKFKPAGEFIKKAFVQANDVDGLSLSDFVKQFDEEQMLKTATACETLDELEESGIVDHIVNRFSYVRQFSKSFLFLDFKNKGQRSLFQGMEILKKLYLGEINRLPEDVPTTFLSSMWKSCIYDNNGKIKPRYWEMGFYYALKKKISSGDIYLNHSKNNRYFWDAVSVGDIGDNLELDISSDFENIISNLKGEYHLAANRANRTISKNDFAIIEDSKLKLVKEDALEIPEEVKALRKLIQSNMPSTRIEKLVAEVISLSDCIQAFTSFQTPSIYKNFPRKPLIAAIVAHATNIGLLGMGNSAVGVTVDALHYASTTYLRTETIDKANQYLIDRFLSYPISQELLDGSYSTSDAQRYAVEAKCLLSGFYPRYYGYYEKVLSIYTHQCKGAVFGQNVISCGEREASYVLTSLLENKTSLNPVFHSTDTHGFTEHIFALCYLLGFGFHPRLKDLAEQRLYRIDKSTVYAEIDDLFTSSISFEVIKNYWNEIVRIIYALKHGLTPARVIIQKLANRTDGVSKAIRALGKIIKTIYILRYIADPNLRYKVHLHLNQGESRHQLAKKLFFLNRGVFKTGDLEEIMNKASCLSFLSNAILLWNTHNIQQIVGRLRSSGHSIATEHLRKVSALMLKHIQIHGTYHFESI